MDESIWERLRQKLSEDLTGDNSPGENIFDILRQVLLEGSAGDDSLGRSNWERLRQEMLEGPTGDTGESILKRLKQETLGSLTGEDSTCGNIFILGLEQQFLNLFEGIKSLGGPNWEKLRQKVLEMTTDAESLGGNNWEILTKLRQVLSEGSTGENSLGESSGERLNQELPESSTRDSQSGESFLEGLKRKLSDGSSSGDDSRGLWEAIKRIVPDVLIDDDFKISSLWLDQDSELDPGVLEATRAMEDFRFHIHLTIYISRVYAREVKKGKVTLEDYRKRADMWKCRFASQVDVDGRPMSLLKAVRNARRLTEWFEHQTQISESDVSSLENRFPNLGRYIASNKRAVDLTFRIRQSMTYSFYGIWADRWDIVFINTFESLRLKYERDKEFPLWDLLGKKMAAYLEKNSDIPYLGEDREDKSDITHRILLQFNNIQDKFSQKHAHYICNRYEFHCKYFDDELANMFKFMRDFSKTNFTTRFAIDIWSQPERNLDVFRDFFALEALQDSGFFGEDEDVKCAYQNAYLKYGHQLQYYRQCLNSRELQLADFWMADCFKRNYRKEILLILFMKQEGVLQNKSGEYEERIGLNGRHEGMSSDYRLPVKRTTPVMPSEKPWWVTKLRTPQGSNETEPSAKKCRLAESEKSNEEYSCSSQAPTILPSKRSEAISPNELRQGARETNRAAAKFYRESNKLSDDSMNSVPMCPITLTLEKPLNIKWKDDNGREHARSMNMVKGEMYHCRTFSHDAANDEWLGSDVVCRVLSQMEVKEEGLSRIPINGDCGMNSKQYGIEPLFKVYKDRGDHTINNYLADVRAQSIAAYYADRFRDLTEDKFGELQMVNSEVFLVFDSSKRETIIEMMLHEPRVIGKNTKIKFTKFTNNWSSKNREFKIDILEAYSHFSYDESDGVLMVTDLQGMWSLVPGRNIVYILTDPAIHCQTRRPTLFGRTNFGVEGMRAFFSGVHKECNEICNYLTLRRPDWET